MNDMTNVVEIERQIADGELSADDPQVIDLINKLSGDESSAAGDESGDRADPAGEDADAEAAKVAAEAKAVEEAAAAKTTAGEEAGKAILSKDGKHTIPYDVLETARANEEAAIAAAKQLAAITQALEQQVQELRAGKGAGEAKQEIPPMRAALDAAKAQVEELAKEYPDIAPSQKAILESMATMAEQLYGQIARQQEVIDHLGKAAAQTVNDRQNAAKETAKDAIAQVPALVVWQTKNPALFKLAATFDDTLKVDPDWKAKPMAERFQKAVEMVVAVKGPSVLDGIAPVQQSTNKESGKKPTTAQEAIARALGITSLSDLPAGMAVSQDPGSLDALSESQLTDRLAGIKDDADLLNFMANAIT